jgi:hypothetical protein
MCQDTNFERKEKKNGSRGMFFAVSETYIFFVSFFGGGKECVHIPQKIALFLKIKLFSEKIGLFNTYFLLFVKIEAEKKALFSHVFSLIISYFRRK